MAGTIPKNTTMHGKQGEAQRDRNNRSPKSCLYPYPEHPKKLCTHILGVSKNGFEDGLWLGEWVIPPASYMVGFVV